MDQDTRFVCARDLYEGIEARPGAGQPFRRVEEIMNSPLGHLVVWFEGNRRHTYERDEEVEVVA